MAWIEQTKKGSRKSGGPQYYLQGLSENVSAVLSAKRRRPVRLWTPYGVLVDTGLVAVSKTVGSVGHDRVQVARKGAAQVAGQVAYWYGLRSAVIETIEFHDDLDEAALVLNPTQVTFFGAKRPQRIEKDSHPLSLNEQHRSRLLSKELVAGAGRCPACKGWVVAQIADLVKQHQEELTGLDERDLLRASGALSRLGLELGPYRCRDIDCPDATFRFGDLPPYGCPVEIEELSSGFRAAHHDRHRQSRAVVLCMRNDDPGIMTGYVDVIELSAVARLLKGTA